MGINENELSALQAIATTTSTLSVFGSSLIIVSLLRKKKSSGLTALDTTDRLVFGMSILDILLALSFALGQLPYVLSGADGFFCQLQAFGIEAFGLMTVLWNSCIAHNLFAWVVQKKDLSALGSNYFKYYIVVAVICPCALSVVVASLKTFGFASLWCWFDVEHEYLRFSCFYVVVGLAWCFNAFVFMSVSKSIRKRFENSRGPASASLTAASKNVRSKMKQYMFVFFFVWFFGLLNRFIQSVTGEVYFLPMLLHVLFVPSQGFLNAVVFGSLLSSATFRDLTNRLRATACGRMLCPSGGLGAGGKPGSESLLKNASPTSFFGATRKTGEGGGAGRGASNSRSGGRKSEWSSPASTLGRKRVRLFVSTYNLAEKTASELGPTVDDWLLPLDFDVYAVGEQECM